MVSSPMNCYPKNLVPPAWRFAALLLFAVATGLKAQEAPAYKNPALPVQDRVADLLQRMTPEEKARQLDMFFGCESLLATNQFAIRTHAKPDAVLDPALAEKN